MTIFGILKQEEIVTSVFQTQNLGTRNKMILAFSIYTEPFIYIRNVDMLRNFKVSEEYEYCDSSSERIRKINYGGSGKNILDRFETLWDVNNGITPLFVSEGSSDDKLKSICRSEYLSFAYNEFSNHEGVLVIFGHSLGGSDKHLIEAIKRSKTSIIAFYVRRGTSDADIVARKYDLSQKLPNKTLLFFDAQTHPLGDLSLNLSI